MASNFQSRFTSYEFVKGVKSSGFSFTCYKEKVDWDRIAQVDLDRVVRDLDISVLQDHVSTVVRCDLGELRGIDPGLVKLFRVAQLCLEYCIFCQEQLTSCQQQLEQAHEQSLKELETSNKELKLKKDELKKEIKKRKKLNHQKENIVSSAFQCTKCPKAFLSLSFLESHMKRRHLGEGLEQSREGEGKLQAELDAMRLELLREKEASSTAALTAKESQVAREEALWVQVEKAQAEQRARHQAELTDLTQTFQTQLKQNLSSQQWVPTLPTDSRALETQLQEQISVMQMQLERKKEEEVQAARAQAEQVWQRRLESTEAWHRAERDKLQAQLDVQRAEEQNRLLELEARQQEALAANAAAASQSVPKPAMRRRRSELQPRIKAPESPLPSQSKQTSSNSRLATAKPITDSVRPTNAPPPAPRRRLNLSHPQVCTTETTARPWSSSPHTSNKSAEPLESPPPSLPPPSAPVRAPKTASVAKCKPSAPSPAPPVQQPLRPPVKPSSSSDRDSSSDQEEQEEEPVPQTIQDMKEALRQNPDILRSLREDVEAHVTVRLAELGVEPDTEGLSQAELSRVSALINHHRKVSKKKFKDFSHIRHNLERTVQDKMVEHGVIENNKVSNEPNVKPSKVKRSGQTGFLAKLTDRYHRKNKNKATESKMFTSTPVKKTGATSADTPQGILKLSREQLWLGGKGAVSEPASPSKSPESPRALQRALSLPAPKSVTFASAEQRASSPSSSSWDHDTEELGQLPLTPSQTQLESTTDLEVASGNTTIVKDRPKSAFQTSVAVHQQSRATTKTDAEHKTVLNFLASEMPDVQPRASGSGEFVKPASKSTVAASNRSDKSSTAEANDNSWDLEDL